MRLGQVEKMPRLVITAHRYKCLGCDWTAEGDQRTLTRGIRLHNKLKHGGIQNEYMDFTKVIQLSNQESQKYKKTNYTDLEPIFRA